MTPEEKITKLGQIADQIKALENEHMAFMAQFNTKVADLFTQIAKLETKHVFLVPEPKPKRAYTKRKPKITPVVISNDPGQEPA